MIRPFRLRDSYLLQKLARQSVPLHLERHLTQPHWPLWTALGAPVPWYGSGAATFVNRRANERDLPEGFIQASKHLGRSEADMCYIAPRLNQNDRVGDAWRALLKQLITHAGDFGIQRLYACLPTQDEAAGIVASAGFTPYVRETLFRYRPSERKPPEPSSAPNVRPQRERDGLALQRLSDRYTPPVVQKAEGAFTRENGNDAPHLIFQNWWQPGKMEGLVYEQNGDILGVVRIRRGDKGHWLHFMGDVTQRDVMTALLAESLRRLQNDGHPVYCGIRPHQNALGAVLTDYAFRSAMELTRFVKHTTVRIREPATNKTRLLIETSFPGVISTDVRPKTKTPSSLP